MRRAGKTGGKAGAGALALALAAALGGLAGGCTRMKASDPGCRRDTDCGDGFACTGGACLPREPGRTQMLAVELLPRTDSASAPTELPGIALGPDSLALIAEQKVVVEGTVTDIERVVFSDGGHLVVSVPSRIGGRAPLQFETDLASRAFQIGLPAGLLGTAVTLSLYPATDKLAQPPVVFTATLAERMSLPLPRRDQMAAVRGKLLGALGEPAAGYTARAYLGKVLVSNAAPTDGAGAFELLVPPGSVPVAGAGAAPPTVSIEFQPPRENLMPRFVSRALAIDAVGIAGEAPVFRLPAWGAPGPLRFVVMAGEVNSQRVVEATVRFRTVIPALPSGSAIYLREARTESNGEVELMLIPGTAAEARLYDITVIPPANSPYATRCLPGVSVTAVGALGAPLYGSTLMLERKVRVDGVVRDSAGAPAASVTVTATRLSDAGASCDDLPPISPVTVATDREGRYMLNVDPGSYRLDLDPAAGAPLPRLTQTGAEALVLASDRVHDVTLPPGTVLAGVASDGGGAPVASAAVRIFEVLCAAGSCGPAGASEPLLRAQTRTDAAGAFRAVLPVPRD